MICLSTNELSLSQILDLYPIPFVPDEQVLTSRKRLDALREALDEIFGLPCGSLLGDRLHNAEHIFSAMTDFSH